MACKDFHVSAVEKKGRCDRFSKAGDGACTIGLPRCAPQEPPVGSRGRQPPLKEHPLRLRPPGGPPVNGSFSFGQQTARRGGRTRGAACKPEAAASGYQQTARRGGRTRGAALQGYANPIRCGGHIHRGDTPKSLFAHNESAMATSLFQISVAVFLIFVICTAFEWPCPLLQKDPIIIASPTATS